MCCDNMMFWSSVSNIGRYINNFQCISLLHNWHIGRSYIVMVTRYFYDMRYVYIQEVIKCLIFNITFPYFIYKLDLRSPIHRLSFKKFKDIFKLSKFVVFTTQMLANWWNWPYRLFSFAIRSLYGSFIFVFNRYWCFSSTGISGCFSFDRYAPVLHLG